MKKHVEVFVKKGLSPHVVKRNLSGIPESAYRVVTQVEDLSQNSGVSLLSMGGEGTLLLAMQHLLNQGVIRQNIGLYPAGMNNVLHTTLVTAKQTQSVADFFRELKTDQRNGKFKPYQPGVVNLEHPQLFFNHVGLGSFEVRNSLYSGYLRKLGSKARKLVSPAMALAAELFGSHDQNDILSIYSTIPTMANKFVFPGQDVFDKKITHIQLERSQRLQDLRKLFLILLMWQRGLPTRIPQSMLKVTQSESFKLKTLPQSLWIDGDVIHKNGARPPESGELSVSRFSAAPYVVALTPTQE